MYAKYIIILMCNNRWCSHVRERKEVGESGRNNYLLIASLIVDVAIKHVHKIETKDTKRIQLRPCIRSVVTNKHKIKKTRL